MQIKTKRKLGALVAIAILFLLVGVVTMLYDNDNVQVSANTGKDTIASYADAGTVLVSKYADIEVSNCNGQLAWQQIENTYRYFSRVAAYHSLGQGLKAKLQCFKQGSVLL